MAKYVWFLNSVIWFVLACLHLHDGNFERGNVILIISFVCLALFKLDAIIEKIGA